MASMPGSVLERGGLLGQPLEVTIPAGAPGWHDGVYRRAAGDAAQVPWAGLRPNPALVRWLNNDAAARIRPGCRAMVAGFGLGDDVVELIGRGFDAVGVDVSPTAAEWAKQRWPEHADAFLCEDLLNVPTRLRGRFDLVVEIHTIQSVEPSLRPAIAAGIASLRHPRGCVMAVCRKREECIALGDEAGPPWGLTQCELEELMRSQGLCAVEPFEELTEEEGTGTVARMRGVFGV